MRFISAYSRTRVVVLAAALLALALVPSIANAAPRQVKLRFSSFTYSTVEPTSGTSTFTATVLRSGNTRVPATVDYTTQDGTAKAGFDYNAASETVSFAAGETKKLIAVTILHNGIMGPASKSFSIKLSNATVSGASVALPPGQTTATVSILDTDGPGTIDFSAPTYSVVESAGVATITVNRASASNLVESVDFTTTQLPAGTGHATAGLDYTTTSGTLTFATGEMSKTFQVPIVDDTIYEGNETLQLTLSNPRNLTTPDQPVLGPNTPATLTIVDDDAPTFSFHQPTYSVNEDGGNATITVDRSGDTTIPASIDYATSDGTAVAGTDYTAASGTLNFAAGQTQASFHVPVALNGVPNEGNKTVNLTLSSSGITVDTALLSIVEADPGSSTTSAQLSNDAYSVTEGDGQVAIAVTLSKPAVGGEKVHLATTDGTASSVATSTPGTPDFTAVSTDVTFQAGQDHQVVSIPIVNDSVPETDETFTVNLTAPTGVVLGAPSQATVTIHDDDGAGTLDFSALRYDVKESAGHATITVVRNGGSAGAASVDYFTTDGTAHAPGDYTPTSGTLNFADGETVKTFAIPIAWDGVADGDKTVSIGLRNFDSDDDPATVKAAVLHIADDGASGPVQFSAPSYNVLESAGAATITVSRSGGSLGGPVTVDYATSDGTAHAGKDYTATHGTLTFAPGEASATFQVPVHNDTIHQGGRSLTLTLSNPGGGTSLGGQPTAKLTIGDDDPITSPSRARVMLKLSARRLQRVSSKRLVFTIRSSAPVKLAIGANLSKGKRLVKVAGASKRIAASRNVTVTLRLSGRALNSLRSARVKGKERVTFTVTGTDALGNRATVRLTITVR